jgi:type IV secretory pathway VirB2 component (pilin)
MSNALLKIIRRDIAGPVFVSLLVLLVIAGGLELLRPGYFAFEFQWGLLGLLLVVTGGISEYLGTYHWFKILLTVLMLCFAIAIMFLRIDFQSVFDILVGVVILFALPVSIYSIK